MADGFGGVKQRRIDFFIYGRRQLSIAARRHRAAHEPTLRRRHHIAIDNKCFFDISSSRNEHEGEHNITLCLSTCFALLIKK